MEYEPVLKSSFRGAYKKRSILFGNNDGQRVLRAQKMSTDRRDRRNKDFESRRDLNEETISPHLTPTLEERDEPAQVAVPVIDAIDRRRLALQKWKEEKEKKKLIMDKLKKPIFKTGVVQHRIYSPAPPSIPHNHAGSKAGQHSSLAPKHHTFNFKVAKLTVATSPVALKRSYQARSKAEDTKEDTATRGLGCVTRARARQIAQVQKMARLNPINNMAKTRKLAEENFMLDSLPLKILPQGAGGTGDSRNLTLVPSARAEGKAPPFVTMTASAYEAKTPGASCFKRDLQTPAKVIGKTPANTQGKTPAQTLANKVIGKTPAQPPANKVIGKTPANTLRTPAQPPANKVIGKTPTNALRTPAQPPANKVIGKTPANTLRTPAQPPANKVIGKTSANTLRTPAQPPANKVIGKTSANTLRTPAQPPANKVIGKTPANTLRTPAQPPANKVIRKTPAQTSTNTRGQKTVQTVTTTALIKTPACYGTNTQRNTSDQSSVQALLKTGTAYKSTDIIMDARRSLNMEFDNVALDEENGHDTNTIDEMDATKVTVTSSTEDKIEHKTPESIENEDTKTPLRDEVYPVQGSPFVTTTRGRCGSASYTRARASSINKLLSLTVCLSEPFALSKETTSSSELNVKHFRDTLVLERNTLIAKCEYWQAIQSTDPEIPLNVHELVDSAVGQTRLLVTKKFVQFEGLMDMCETGQGRRVTLEDLQGFWEMVYMQVVDVNHRFSQLELLRANSWHQESSVKKMTRQRAQNKKGVNKTKGNVKSSIKNIILAARKKKKENCSSNDWTDENTLAVNVLDFQHTLPTPQPLDKTSVLPVSPGNSDQVKQPLRAIDVNTPPRKSILKPTGRKTGDYTQRRRSARINVKFIDVDSSSENDPKCEFPLTPHVRSRSRMSSMLPGLNSTTSPAMALPSGDLISLDSPFEEPARIIRSSKRLSSIR